MTTPYFKYKHKKATTLTDDSDSIQLNWSQMVARKSKVTKFDDWQDEKEGRASTQRDLKIMRTSPLVTKEQERLQGDIKTLKQPASGRKQKRPEPVVVAKNNRFVLPLDRLSPEHRKPNTSQTTKNQAIIKIGQNFARLQYPQQIMHQMAELCSKQSRLSPSQKGSAFDKSISLGKTFCDLRNLTDNSFRSHGKPCRKDHIWDRLGQPKSKRQSVNSGKRSSIKKRLPFTDAVINKQKGMDQFLNLEKCSMPSDSMSVSFGSGACQEEDQDYITDIPSNGKRDAEKKQEQKKKMHRHYPQSSQSLFNFRVSPICYNRGTTLRQLDLKKPDSSPQGPRSHNGDVISVLESSPRRSISVKRRFLVDLGRSPKSPFVQNPRTALKRHSSQRFYQRRNFSPQDQTLYYEAERISDKGQWKWQTSSRKSSSNKKRPTKRNTTKEVLTNSAEKQSLQKSSSQASLLKKPGDIFKKYEDFPDHSLKLSVYRDCVMQIMQEINIIQRIKKFPPIQPLTKVDFQFKKEGYNKLLIFDLDETLIHSMRDPDETEDEYLSALYEQYEPDMWIQMESPSSNYGSFVQGVYVRPYLHECLQAANEDYEVAVFTASYDWYANFIIDKIDPKGKLIQHRFFRQHAQTITHEGKESVYKDLTIFQGLDLTRTLIVDNSVFSFAKQLSNGVPITSFFPCKNDYELIKVMKYVHQIASEENLPLANEKQFGLMAMLETPIDKFVQYYEIGEMSESDENDWEEDGRSLGSSQKRLGRPMKISRRNVEDDNSEEIEIQSSDSSQNIKLNESLEENQLSLASADKPAQREGPNNSSKLLKLQVVPLMETEAQLNVPNSMEVPQLYRFQSAVQPRTNQGLTADEQYTLISKKDEGNIGGTLSNAPLRSSGQLAQLSPQQESQPVLEPSVSAVVPFGEVLRQETEDLTELRVTVTASSPDQANDSEADQEQIHRPKSPQHLPKKTLQQQMTMEPVSSYFKVSLTSEKARRRQRSSQHTVTSNAAQSFGSPHISMRNCGAQIQTNSNRNSNDRASEVINNYYQTSGALQKKLPAPSQRFRFGVDQRQGSDSFRGLPTPHQRDLSEGKETKTFADIVEVERETLTSVKKANKAAIQIQRSEAQTDVKRTKRQMPSESFITNVVLNVNNMLKPPNWNVRRRQKMDSQNALGSPGCVSNIDFHVEQLANIYRENGKKVREGTEPSLMEQLLEANRDNASFLTPSSRSQLTQSMLSDQKHFNRNISSNSMDKYQQLKRSVNRSSKEVSSLRQSFYCQHRSTTMAVFDAQKLSEKTLPSLNSYSPNVQHMNNNVRAGGGHHSQIGVGLLPPRPTLNRKTLHTSPLQSEEEQLRDNQLTRPLHSQPNKEVRNLMNLEQPVSASGPAQPPIGTTTKDSLIDSSSVLDGSGVRPKEEDL